jgi:hypothetical protein
MPEIDQTNEADIQDRWTRAMLRGDFEAAWRISDDVMARRGPGALNRRDQPFHLRHVWNGAPLAGKDVLVRCYHGLGDTIQFARYLPMLRAVARTVTVQAVPVLHGLLGTVAGIDRLVVLDYDAPDPTFDVDIEIMELPHAFRTALGSIPDAIPYLGVDTARLSEAASRVGHAAGLRVGIAWSVGEWDRRRVVPLDAFAPLASIPGVALFNLQRGPALDEIAGSPLRFADDPSTWTDDILDTAATMLNLDLAISVDTMAAHLAGALGVRVWTLLHAAADWRWMEGRDDSPWYPSMRLFRQRAPGDWRPVIEAVTAQLRQEADSRRAIAEINSPISS